MTHPLTKELNRGTNIPPQYSTDEIIHRWAKERAEWLKKQGYDRHAKAEELIDQAFQLEPESLEEKFNNHCHGCIVETLLKELAAIAEEHYKEKANGKE